LLLIQGLRHANWFAGFLCFLNRARNRFVGNFTAENIGRGNELVLAAVAYEIDYEARWLFAGSNCTAAKLWRLWPVNDSRQWASERPTI
jgi:hypothetical protein